MVEKRTVKKQLQAGSSWAEPRVMKISLPKEPWINTPVEEEKRKPEPAVKNMRNPRHMSVFK